MTAAISGLSRLLFLEFSLILIFTWGSCQSAAAADQFSRMHRGMNIMEGDPVWDRSGKAWFKPEQFDLLRDAGFDTSTPTYGSARHHRENDRGGTGRNVIAQTRTGDPGRVVMIGAHLDSVPEGPGIVDNGSGVATLLEIATRLGAQPDVRNAVRFAFFGSEENDAEGSSGYVDGLSRDDRQKIKLYLNVDMVASPNAGYIVQGGAGEDEEGAGPPGSATVGGVLAAELAKTGVAAPEITEFVGDDESAFIDAGIPAGGAENGDAKKKTAEQARNWGGQAGEVYDRCYHQACDGIGNVNREVLSNYLKAIATTLAHFATSTDDLR